MSDSISGRVSKVIFNRDNFYILAMHIADSDPPVANRTETAKGNIFGLIQVKPGVTIQLTGKWVRDSKHGRQFKVQSWEPWAETAQDVVHFLHTSVKGFVDEELASVLAREYNLNTFKQLTEKPAEVQDFLVGERCGADDDDAQEALRGWESALATRDISELLQAGGLGPSKVQAAVKKFGFKAASVIRTNPYRLMEVPAFPFPQVDKLARNLGVAVDDSRRVEGAVLWAVRTAARQGHLYLSRRQVMPHVKRLLEEHQLISVVRADPKPVFLAALRSLVGRKALILDPDAGLYTPELYDYERESAKILSELLDPAELDVDLKPFLEKYEQRNGITLSEAQREAVSMLGENRVLVLTGLPGTGKTTAIRVLVRAFEEAQIQFALMAPTGIAAKRLAAVTGHDASTIHRALKFDGSSWGHHADNRILFDAVIVDEVSMVDQELLYRLLIALRPETRVVFVGDDAQLPSVGPGNVLRELAECSDIPNVRLTQIFRQSAEGGIVANAHKINRGEKLTFPATTEKTEFRYVRTSDESAIARLIVQMAAKLKDRDENFQVLSPKYKTTVGVDNLNEMLRDTLNPEGPREWVRGEQRFRLGDRLMVTSNDYRRSVYNGDVGKLVQVGPEGVVVKIHGVGEDGMDMEVSFDEDATKSKLKLAYAITVHKSQGSEFDTIILPIVSSQGRMLQRNLLYTAITRARKRVWLIGEERAIQRAIDNNNVTQRNTAFSKAISDATATGVQRPNGEHDERNEESAGRPITGTTGETNETGEEHEL